MNVSQKYSIVPAVCKIEQPQTLPGICQHLQSVLCRNRTQQRTSSSSGDELGLSSVICLVSR